MTFIQFFNEFSKPKLKLQLAQQKSENRKIGVHSKIYEGDVNEVNDVRHSGTQCCALFESISRVLGTALRFLCFFFRSLLFKESREEKLKMITGRRFSAVAGVEE